MSEMIIPLDTRLTLHKQSKESLVETIVELMLEKHALWVENQKQRDAMRILVKSADHYHLIDAMKALGSL